LKRSCSLAQDATDLLLCVLRVLCERFFPSPPIGSQNRSPDPLALVAV